MAGYTSGADTPPTRSGSPPVSRLDPFAMNPSGLPTDNWYRCPVTSLRHTVRELWMRPGFTAVVVLTLALGIRANTASFSFVNALLIRPFPFREADQLVEIRSMRGGQPGRL